jgi:hypothetical protein
MVCDPPSPGPTPRELEIEATCRRTWDNYYYPVDMSILADWASTPCFDPYITARLQTLYADLEQTKKHHGIFYVAKLKLPSIKYNADGLPTNEYLCTLSETYSRILLLYDARLVYIQAMGQIRTSIWAQWYQERSKSARWRNQALIAAYQSTLEFHEDDYVRRKMEFVTELYALLQKCDLVHASMVLDDLGALWPWTKREFIKRLETVVVDFDKVRLANHIVVRSRRYYKEKKNAESV